MPAPSRRGVRLTPRSHAAARAADGAPGQRCKMCALGPARRPYTGERYAASLPTSICNARDPRPVASALRRRLRHFARRTRRPLTRGRIRHERCAGEAGMRPDDRKETVMVERPQPGGRDGTQAPPLAPPPDPTTTPNPAESPVMPPPRELPTPQAPPIDEPGAPRPGPVTDPPAPDTTPGAPVVDPPPRR